jgi:hypothetical protein
VDLQSGQQAGLGRAAADMIRWRRERLLSVGFDPELAGEISHDSGMDLHALIELVERGCPPPLAVRILAPLEHERRA